MYPKDIPMRIGGIPAIVKVFDYSFHRGNSNAMDPDSYSDSHDLDYVILDTNGRRARWLERKLAEYDNLRDYVEKEIIEEIDREHKGL